METPRAGRRRPGAGVPFPAMKPLPRAGVKDATTPEQRAAAARRLVEMARTKPTVKHAAQGITAELRRQRNQGETG